MNKSALIAAIAANVELPKRDIDTVLEAAGSVIAEHFAAAKSLDGRLNPDF